MPKRNRPAHGTPTTGASDSTFLPTATSLETSIIDTRDTVGMSVDSDLANNPRGSVGIEGTSSDISMGLHPCVCCNISHAKGIIIIAALEIIHWAIFLVFCVSCITYWVVANDPKTQIGNDTYSRTKDYISLRNVLIIYGIFCLAFLCLGIGLLFGVRKEMKCLLLTWLIGTFIVETFRLIFAIVIPIRQIHYGLILWLVRLYEFWVILSFYNKLRKAPRHPKQERRRGFFGWGRRKTSGESVIPALVPITYYGVVKDGDENMMAFNIVGYQLEGEDLKSQR